MEHGQSDELSGVSITFDNMAIADDRAVLAVSKGRLLQRLYGIWGHFSPAWPSDERASLMTPCTTTAEGSHGSEPREELSRALCFQTERTVIAMQ